METGHFCTPMPCIGQEQAMPLREPRDHQARHSPSPSRIQTPPIRRMRKLPSTHPSQWEEPTIGARGIVNLMRPERCQGTGLPSIKVDSHVSLAALRSLKERARSSW